MFSVTLLSAKSIVPSAATVTFSNTEARQDIERFMGTKVYLETWVKVKENWRDNMNYIRSFGYNDQ